MLNLTVHSSTSVRLCGLLSNLEALLSRQVPLTTCGSSVVGEPQMATAEAAAAPTLLGLADYGSDSQDTEGQSVADKSGNAEH